MPLYTLLLCTACHDPSVTIANLDTGKEWQATNDSGSYYYQLVLDYGTDVNATKQLRFQISRSGSEQCRRCSRKNVKSALDLTLQCIVDSQSFSLARFNCPGSVIRK